MQIARSDNKTVTGAIEAMSALVVSQGGYVHPAAAIEENDGSLRVISDAPLAEGEPLFRIPFRLLVPTDGLCWTDSEETMELASLPGDLSSDQAALLDMFIAIYNATGKLAWHQMHASRVLLRDAELAAQLELIRPAYIVGSLSPAATFLETRSYSSKHLPAGMADRYCVMPLIDFSNHHVKGSAYRHETGCLQADINYPQDSNECFTNYGKRRDPLSLALGHGYSDPNSPYANSVPVVIDFAGFGRLEVAARPIHADHRADPPKVEFHDDGLTLSHLSASVESPHYLQATLRLAMMASGKRRGIPEAAIERALAEAPCAILAANQEKFAAFQAYLATRADLPLAAILAEASLHQLANLKAILTP